MWDSVLVVFGEKLKLAISTYLVKAKSGLDVAHAEFQPAHDVSGFNCTEEENTSSLNTLRRRAWQALRAKVDEQTSDANILSKLRSTFEERFRYDVNGVPAGMETG